MMQCGTEKLRTLAAQKEKEWRDVENQRIQSLELALENLQKEQKHEKDKFLSLKEDFKHNLKLISEQDADLCKYESDICELKVQLVAKEREMSDVKIQMADLETDLKRERQDKHEVHKILQKRIREKQAEVEQYYCKKDAEIVEERREIETFKQKLERRVIELEEELEIQRRELNTEFESTMKKREHEFRLQQDEISSQLLAQQLKVKLLEQELESLKKEKAIHQQELYNAEENCRHVEKELKQSQWQKDDELAITHAKLSDMQLKVQNAEAALNRAKEDFERKHVELDSRAKEKDLLLHQVKEAFVEKEYLVQEETNTLKQQITERDVVYRQLQWDKIEMERQLEQKIEQLQDEKNEVEMKLTKNENDVLSLKSTTDGEVLVLQDQVSQFKIQIEERKKDIERYKRELLSAAEREASLEKSKAQLSLDWQRKCEDIENKQFEKSENLVKSLTKTRDIAQANMKELQREVEHKDQLIQMLSVEREQAFATLKQYGVTIDRNVTYDVDDLPPSITEQVQSIQHQNDTLKQVIRSMRDEMEVVGSSAVTEGYVRQLETELKELKAKQTAEQNLKKLDAMAGSNEGSKDIGSDNILVRSHIDALNDTIGQLRTEKIELGATVRKQQAQLIHLEAKVDQLSKMPKEQESALTELQYKTGAMERRYQAEILGHKQQVSHLESQLKEAHSLADSYHKAVMEANCENASLRQQLSASKMEIAEGRPSVNFGAQELLIQQLQDEIQHLRKQLKGRRESSEIGRKTKGTNTELQAKYRQAVSHNIQLAKEKTQLIECCNRLRAELIQQGNADVIPPATLKTIQPSQLQTNIHNKRKDLEKLQYQLTKRELTIQKQEAPPKITIPPEVMHSEDLESEEDQPKSILKKSNSSTENRLKSSTEIMNSDPHHIVSESFESKSPDAFLGSFSSVGAASLQEVWNILDNVEKLSSGPPTPPKSPHRSNPFSSTLQVKGQTTSMVERPTHPPKSPPVRQRVAQRGRGGKSKFTARNWNEK